jgi:uncharacterized protein YegL
MAAFELRCSTPQSFIGARLRPIRLTAVVVSLCGAIGLACGDGTGPERPHSLQLSAVARVDTNTFPFDGLFDLELVPYDDTGTRYIIDAWQIGVTLGSPDSISLSVSDQRLDAPDTVPTAAAILIDDSGSMLGSDPDRERAGAAQLFWQAVLAARVGNLVALLDFGRGDVPATAGFRDTRLIQTFTSEAATLDVQATSIQAASGGGTHLYRSGTEVARWVDSTVPTTGYKRSMVVMTDGKPGDTEFQDPFFTAVAEAKVRVFAVGLGVAADPTSAAVQVVKELAKRTGGVYAAASSPKDLKSILSVLASASSDSRLFVRVHLSPIPPTGTPVEGTVSISGMRGTAQATWSFVVP